MFKQIRNVFLNLSLDQYRSRKQQRAVLTREHALATAAGMLRNAKYGFLITHGTDNWCSARLVQPLFDRDAFVIWFGAHPASRKVQEIEQNPHVTFAIENTQEHANLVLYGMARIERDGAIKKKWWLSSWRLFFPAGPTSDDYVAIRFEPQRMELMNFKQNVIPEPFGLRPLVLQKHDGRWELAEHAAPPS